MTFLKSRRRRFLRERLSLAHYAALVSISFALLISSWIVISTLRVVQPLFLPSPVDVLNAFSSALKRGELLRDLWASAWRVTAGFLMGAGLAIPVGVLMGSLKSAEALLRPPTEFVRYMPVPAFLPLCILWFGIGDLEKIFVIFLGTFFQLVVLIADDARRVPNELLEIGYTLGFNRWQSLWRVILPGAMPQIFDDLRVSFGWAWSYLIVAEIVASNRGLGFMIMQSQRYLRTADVVYGVLLIGLIGLTADWIFRAMAAVIFPYEDVRN